MIEMVKRDFILNRILTSLIIVYTPFVYIMNGDPLYVYGGITVGLIFNVFYYDNKNHINRFITSLPIDKQTVVFGRYLFLVFAIISVLLYQWLIDSIAHAGLPYLGAVPITSATIGLIFLSLSVATAITLPIFYFFESFMKATTLLLILLFMGIFSMAIISSFIDFPPFIIEIVNRSPFLIPVIFALICLYGSFRLSAWIFMRKDIN